MLDKGNVSGIYKDGYYHDELAAINKSALRYEIDGNELILYYPLSRIFKTLKKPVSHIRGKSKSKTRIHPTLGGFDHE